MKPLILLDKLYRGGAEMAVLDICRNAAVNGLEVGIATGGGAMEAEFRSAGVPYHDIQRRLPVDPLLIRGLRNIVTENGYDIVHAHQAVDGLHGYLATVGTRAKCVLSFQGHFPKRKDGCVMRWLVPRVAANISCSQGLLPWIREQGIDTTGFDVVYNGVDTRRLQYSGPDLREELGLAMDATLFGMVAHFYPAERKDQLTLCRAFAKVAGDIPGSHLVIVGRVEAGAENKYAACVQVIEEAGLTNRVHFLGQRNDLAKVVRSLDIFVFSSFHEGLPIALMEAMLSHKPTILSEIEPHLEVSQKGKYAVTFPTGDSHELAERMLLLARDERERRRLADRAYGFAMETFSIEAHIGNLKEIYSAVLAR